MRNFYFLIIIFFGNLVYAQETEFKFTKDGFLPVVTVVEGSSANDLYDKTIEWIKKYYSNPSEVLKSEVVNEYIRIKGSRNNFYYLKSLMGKEYYDVLYSITFEFKEGKYKFEFVTEKLFFNGKPLISDEKKIFKKDGTVKPAFKEAYDSFIESVKDIYNSHYNYISGKSIIESKNW